MGINLQRGDLTVFFSSPLHSSSAHHRSERTEDEISLSSSRSLVDAPRKPSGEVFDPIVAVSPFGPMTNLGLGYELEDIKTIRERGFEPRARPHSNTMLRITP